MDPHPPEARPPFREFARESRTFFILWLGQLVSGVGSGLTGFAVPVWIYRETGSAEQFGLLMFAALVPSILLSPFAGALVDRWDRRRTLIATDLAAAGISLVLAALALSGRFEAWHLFPIVVVGSALGTFQEPAFASSLRMLVEPKHLARASGMLQMSGSATSIVTPIAGGWLVGTIGLGGVVVIDFVTALVGVGMLFILRIPNPPPSAEGAARSSLLRDAAAGWGFFRARPGLLALVVGLAVYNFWVGMVNPLLQPMVLSFAPPAVLGPVVSMAAVGALTGGVVVSAWGGPRRKVRGILAAAAWSGLCVALAGFKPWVPLIAVAFFATAFANPVVAATSFALWAAKVPPDMLGRVFAVRRLISLSTLPPALLLAGPLAERVFDPLMAPDGALAPTVGAVLGTGQGRGIGLMYVLLGALMALTALTLYMIPAIRNLEREVPDVPRPEPVPAPGPAVAAAG